MNSSEKNILQRIIDGTGVEGLPKPGSEYEQMLYELAKKEASGGSSGSSGGTIEIPRLDSIMLDLLQIFESNTFISRALTSEELEFFTGFNYIGFMSYLNYEGTDNYVFFKYDLTLFSQVLNFSTSLNINNEMVIYSLLVDFDTNFIVITPSPIIKEDKIKVDERFIAWEGSVVESTTPVQIDLTNDLSWVEDIEWDNVLYVTAKISNGGHYDTVNVGVKQLHNVLKSLHFPLLNNNALNDNLILFIDRNEDTTITGHLWIHTQNGELTYEQSLANTLLNYHFCHIKIYTLE